MSKIADVESILIKSQSYNVNQDKVWIVIDETF